MSFVDKDRIAIWGWVSTQISLAGLLFNCNIFSGVKVCLLHAF